MKLKAGYRRDIQVFRGLAVLSVILFHAFDQVFRLGFLGVDSFFVISGFVVTPLILRIYQDQDSMENSKTKLIYFYKRRFMRLAPAVTVTLIVATLLIVFFGPPSDHRRFARQGISTLLLLGNFGAARYSGDYFSPNPNPLVHTWSLSVEEQIYFVLPIAVSVVLLSRTNRNKLAKVVLSTISLISFILFLFPNLMHNFYSIFGVYYSDQLFLFYSPLERVWQFGLGGIGYLVLKNERYKARDLSKPINLLLVCAVTFILLAPLNLNQKIGTVILSLLTFLVIMFTSLNILPSKLFRFLEWLGDRSFSLYLIHMPLIYLALYSPAFSIGEDKNRVFQAIVAIALTVFLGSLSYSKIEVRFRSRNLLLKTGKAKFTAFATSLILLPLATFAAMDRGISHQYWGLDKNLVSPASDAWGPNAECNQVIDDEGLCFYHPLDSRPKVLLIGDSHAAHYSSAIANAADALKWNLGTWTLGNCSFQLGKTRNEELTSQCELRNLAILEWIKVNTPSVVIVSQYVHKDSSQKNLRQGLDLIRKLGPDVLLVENNPIFPDEKDFMRGRPLLMKPYLPPKSFKWEEMQLIDVPASESLANWAEMNGIRTISINQLFCPNQICSRYADGRWLYSDFGHLSLDGAAMTSTKFEEIFRKL